MSAGTVSTSAGTYSPFVYRLQRSDDDQEFSQLGVTLPKGLLANISGISKCSGAAIAAAEAPGRTGTEEARQPELSGLLADRHHRRRHRRRPGPHLHPRQGLPRRPLQGGPVEHGRDHPGPHRPLRPRRDRGQEQDRGRHRRPPRPRSRPTPSRRSSRGSRCGSGTSGSRSTATGRSINPTGCEPEGDRLAGDRDWRRRQHHRRRHRGGSERSLPGGQLRRTCPSPRSSPSSSRAAPTAATTRPSPRR